MDAMISGPAEMAIATRRSVRGFLPQPVPPELVKHLLALASRAPSMTNTQPWKVHVLTGAALRRLCDAVGAAFEAGRAGQMEYDYAPPQWWSPYLERRRQIGWALYGLLGIAKGDRQATHRQHARNFTFFGAPVGMIFTIERDLLAGSFLDYGMFLQNIMIAARSYGLDTCPQAAFGNYHAIIKAQLGIAADERVVCGMALGHADPDEPANRLEVPREPVESFTVFHE